MRRSLYILLVAVLIAGCGRFQSQPTSSVAHDLRDAALKQAKKEGKRVFLWFATADPGWCELMDRFLADPEVATLLGRHLIPVKIDVHQTPGGMQLYLDMGADRGVPAFSILDESGVILADSGSQDQSTNIGFPTTVAELNGFDTALRTACPTLTDDDLRFLRAKLQEIGQAHEEAQPKEKPTESETTPSLEPTNHIPAH